MPENDILVCGFPKSGNTWLSRLLGDTMNSRVSGWGTAHPLAEEGSDRPGKYIVRQLHLRPVMRNLKPNFTAWEYSFPGANFERLALIVRHPLDVAVSMYYYWDMPSIQDAINTVLHGGKPVERIGSWIDFYNKWMEVFDDLPYISLTRYEDLLEDPNHELRNIGFNLGIPSEDFLPRLPGAIERQAFTVRKSELANSGNKYNYGHVIQTKNMRAGRVGDYKNMMSAEQINSAEQYIRDHVCAEMRAYYDLLDI